MQRIAPIEIARSGNDNEVHVPQGLNGNLLFSTDQLSPRSSLSKRPRGLGPHVEYFPDLRSAIRRRPLPFLAQHLHGDFFVVDDKPARVDVDKESQQRRRWKDTRNDLQGIHGGHRPVCLWKYCGDGESVRNSQWLLFRK
jgi:hypothetical protein